MSGQGRDLFKEILEGKFGLVIVSLEMLTSYSFGQVLRDSEFQKQLCLAFIDECDLVEEQGSGFRPCYRSIGDLRARLPTSAPWIAVSATLPKGTFDRVMSSLGFNRGRYIRASLPIDNQHICYIPQFQSYPTSGTTFLDLAWLIPPTVTSIDDITKTLVFCETIALGTHVYKFLQRLLPPSLSSSEVILAYHSLISGNGRSHAMDRFRTGTTWIIVASDCFTWGVDVADIRNVVLFGLLSSFSKLVQQIGRAGRDKKQAYAITYTPSWVEDIPSNSKKGTKLEATELERRDAMCPVLRSWFNPTQACCPRDVLCLLFDEKSSHPQNCCIVHHKDLPAMEPDKSQVLTFTPQPTKLPTVRSNGTYPPFKKKEDGPLCLAISRMISVWTRKKWLQVSGQNSLLPPTSFLSQALQDHLCKKFHTITSIKNLSTILAGWPHLEQYKTDLYSFCEEALKELDKLRKELKGKEAKHKAEEEKVLKIQIKLPQASSPTESLKTQREEFCGADSLVEERPKKRHHGDSEVDV